MHPAQTSMQQARTATAMKLLILTTLSGVAVGSLLGQMRGAGNLNPVTRVVQLLKSLKMKVEQEGQTEEDLYEKFVCWGSSVISGKKASNAAAGARIDELSTYISDLDAGRIELTTERVDLEKEIEQLSADIELATEMRTKENTDFESAKAEMEKAIQALTAAIEVLRTATEDHTDGVLLSMRGQASRGSHSSLAGSAGAAALSHAVELGSKFLTKADALFLRRVLLGEVPEVDWKKLNRPATFKKSYKARSFKIQEVLAKLLETFSTNLQEATGKEQAASQNFQQLMTSKGGEKTSSQEALLRMEKENGAKGLSRSDAEEEKNQLTTQVGDDQAYISQVEQALATKKAEWQARISLRTAELAAISKAISILHSDDARDLFKKSFQSQGHLFLQLSSTAGEQARRGSIVKSLGVLLHSVHDRRLAALVTRLQSGGQFDEVITAIDDMLELLQGEEASDLAKKETCEQDRATQTRDAVLDSRRIDDNTDLINRLISEIAELSRQIAEKEQRVGEIDEEVRKATQLRDDEHLAFQAAKSDDEDAKVLVSEAKTVLATFYADNNLMLAQRRSKQPVVTTPGAAPPPPPPTWDGAYGGKTGESSGIIAVLTMIEEDIQKDMDKAAREEQEALTLFTETTSALNQEKLDLVGQINTLQGHKGDKSTEVQTTKASRHSTKQSLDATMSMIAAADPGCTYFTVNYPVRASNRQIEMDGLEKAKAILSGATFTPPKDPSREMKPGDALLQKLQRHGR